MDKKKDDKYYVEKIIEDLKTIIENTKSVSQENFNVNSILCDSILFRIIQISENTRKLTDEFKVNYPNIPWRAIIGMRNRIVHEYGNVDIVEVYTTITKDIPDLLKQLIKEI